MLVSLRGHFQPVHSVYTDLSANGHELNRRLDHDQLLRLYWDQQVLVGDKKSPRTRYILGDFLFFTLYFTLA